MRYQVRDSLFRFVSFLLFLFFLNHTFSSENKIIRQIYSHLLIGDEFSALKECENGFGLGFSSNAFKEACIRCLAESGRDEKAILLWKKWRGERLSPDILETLAWGVLHQSETSRQMTIHMASLMGAFFTHDVRAVEMIKKQMRSSNAFLRAMAVQLTLEYRDRVLIEEVKHLLAKEKVWYVRLEAIKSLGVIGSEDEKSLLKTMIGNPRSSAEEKALAVASLVNLYEEIELKDLRELLESKRVSLRYLACLVVAHLDDFEKIPALLPLLDDPAPSVRIGALNTLYLLGLKDVPEASLKKIETFMDDPHALLSITAAWLSLDFSPDKALKTLKKWVYSSDSVSRRFGAYALGHSSEEGRKMAKEVIRISPDPFVKVNIALGMMRREADIELVCQILYEFLMTHQEKVMWSQREHPLFQVLSPSLLYHIPEVPQYPTLVDQTIRLDILNHLAILDDAKAAEAIKNFLTHQTFGVSFTASRALLQEGGEEALTILRDLLKEEDQMIRVQAALVLALSRSEPKAIEVLQQSYFSMNREMKVNILGAVGRIGDERSIPFLLELLDEPYQILKVATASALIQCLYH